MVNNTDNSKLYEIVKQTLSNYEAPYNAADWEQMQSILNLVPKSSSFKFKHVLLSFYGSLKSFSKSKTFKFIFSLYMLIGLAVLIGAYFLYTFLNSSKIPNTINSTPQQKIENTTNTETPASGTSQKKSVQSDKKTEEPINTIDSLPPATNADLENSNESVIQKKENNEVEKSGKTKTVSADTNQQLFKKAVESGKPDSLNSSGSANRNDPTTNFNINRREKIISDSLTRYLNLQPQDSLKIPK